MSISESIKKNPQGEDARIIIRREAGRIIQNDLPDEAAALYEELKQAVPAIADAVTREEYEMVLRDLSWLFLPLFTEEERFNLLRTSFLRALQSGINMDSALTRMVYSIPPMIWPEIAPNYLTAMRQNTEQIGAEPIEVRGERQPQAPTLGNYFTDYHFTVGERKVTPLDILQYMNQDPDIIRLPDEEKQLLKRAFYIYEGIKPLSLAEVREHLTPEELEIEKLGRLPAPTPEEREALGIPFSPMAPPVIRLERKPPYVPPPVDLKPKIPQIKPVPVIPMQESAVAPSLAPTIAEAPPITAAKPFFAPSRAVEGASPTTPILAKPKPPTVPPVAVRRPTPPAEPKKEELPSQPIPVTKLAAPPPAPTVPPTQEISAPPKPRSPAEQDEREGQEKIPSRPTHVARQIIRPIGGIGSPAKEGDILGGIPGIDPKDIEPELEGNVVDLKGEGKQSANR